MIFRGENFHRLLNCAAKKATSANFVARMFGNSYKTSKKFFSLEHFLLYVLACFSVAQFLRYLCYSEPPGYAHVK